LTLTGIFAYIAISNAAREGARVVTFWPGKATLTNVNWAIQTEIGNSTVVEWSKVTSINVECGNPFATVSTDAQLEACPSDEPIKITVTYSQDLILSIFFSAPLTLVRSAEMMVP
jgi:hypothetical protein